MRRDTVSFVHASIGADSDFPAPLMNLPASTNVDIGGHEGALPLVNGGADLYGHGAARTSSVLPPEANGTVASAVGLAPVSTGSAFAIDGGRSAPGGQSLASAARMFPAAGVPLGSLSSLLAGGGDDDPAGIDAGGDADAAAVGAAGAASGDSNDGSDAAAAAPRARPPPHRFDSRLLYRRRERLTASVSLCAWASCSDQALGTSFLQALLVALLPFNPIPLLMQLKAYLEVAELNPAEPCVGIAVVGVYEAKHRNVASGIVRNNFKADVLSWDGLCGISVANTVWSSSLATDVRGRTVFEVQAAVPHPGGASQRDLVCARNVIYNLAEAQRCAGHCIGEAFAGAAVCMASPGVRPHVDARLLPPPHAPDSLQPRSSVAAAPWKTAHRRGRTTSLHGANLRAGTSWTSAWGFSAGSGQLTFLILRAWV